jgi:hypothetical protein
MLIVCLRRVLAFDVLPLGTAISKPHLKNHRCPKPWNVSLTKTMVFVKINVSKKFTTNHANQHELAVRKLFETFIFHEISRIKRGTFDLRSRLRFMNVFQQISE